MNLQESGEMYLETIYILKKKSSLVRAIDVGERMGFSKPSVSRAIGLLKSGGYVTVGSDGSINLTDTGIEVAEKIYSRHKSISALLENIGVPPDIASADACKIEHVISDSSFRALKNMSLSTSDSASASFDYDKLTGLLHRDPFCTKVEKLLSQNKCKKYAMCYLDIVKFKAVNDMFGYSEGDKLLVHIAKVLKDLQNKIPLACRNLADRFAFLLDIEDEDLSGSLKNILEITENAGLHFVINCNIGVYVIEDKTDSVNSMIDKAILAHSSIKGNLAVKIEYYTDKMRDLVLSEQEITLEMNAALDEGQFIVYYQPQYSHSTGTLIGAEALVRWNHPKKGLISPMLFIPIFEKNGFIAKLDNYVFEQACKLLKKAKDNNYSTVPVSVNFSKIELYSPTFTERLEQIRKKYGVESKNLHIEITESLLFDDSREINNIIKKLHGYGYIVEMDDFGTRYSSLNVLKDLEFDILKLDMHLLSDNNKSSRGGIIVSSVINMAKWLKMDVIAEGVETVEQADFLKSIGCDYIQGYLYSKPLPEKDFEKLLNSDHVGKTVARSDMIDNPSFSDF